MGTALHIITYACLAIFFIAVGVKFYKYQTMPLHLRWELYPVPHEGHEKAAYGGSFMEEPEYWNNPRHVDKAEELKHMIPEMLLLKALWDHNRSLWYRSFPFHFGLYNMIGALMLIMIGAGLQIAGMDISPAGGILGAALYYLTPVVAFFGLGMCIIGSLGLLQRRLFDEDLKDYTGGADIFNLAFIGAAALLLLIDGAMDPGFGGFRDWVASVFTFDLAYAPASPLTSVAFLVSVLVVAYIPLTHMAHFVVKWFTYHNIRWEDTPQNPGITAQIGEALNYPVTWSAPHIQTDGQPKTWASVATADFSDIEKAEQAANKIKE